MASLYIRNLSAEPKWFLTDASCKDKVVNVRWLR